MRLPGFCGTRRRALAALVQRFLAVEEVSYTRSGVPQRAGWSFGGQDLSRFAMLVSLHTASSDRSDAAGARPRRDRRRARGLRSGFLTCLD